MKTIFIATMVILAGCATVDDVRMTNSAELCYRVATGKFVGLPARVFYAELDSRNEDCSRYSGMIQSRVQADQASINQGLMLLQAAQPRPATTPARQSTNCTSRVVGNTMQTDCW